MLLKYIGLMLVALALGTAVRAEDAAVLPGVVVGVIDGDTVDVRLQSGMVRVRLHAVDAPERDQPHGAASRQMLATLVFRRNVDLQPIEQDRYDRLVARLWLDGLDVNAEMIRQGAAWVYRRYADDPAYCEYEKLARDLRRGLWSLPREQRSAPWEWRQRKTLGHRYTDFDGESVATCIAGLGR